MPTLAPHPRLPLPRATPPRLRHSSFIIHHSSFPTAFTLIELLVVIGIIAVLTAITVPAIRSLTKSNDQSQATNLVRSMISSARAIAISQHRMAGVVFFDESTTYSRPVHKDQTAMQVFVEDYNQIQYNLIPGLTGFTYYSTARQYLPSGIKIAMLSDNIHYLAAGENTTVTPTRAILFDADGNLLLRPGLVAPVPLGLGPGTYNQAYGDWKFLNSPGITSASSSPGFFIYSKNEMDAQGSLTDAVRTLWIYNNSTAIIINANTGGILK